MTDGLDQKFHDRDAVFRRLSRAMSHYFVGPIPPKKFLDSFLPKDPHAPSSSTFQPGMLSGLKDAGSEGDMYTKFVRSNVHPSFSILIYPSPKLFPHVSQVSQA